MAIGGQKSTASATSRAYTRNPSRLYIIAILRLTERTVSKLAELARKLEMICTRRARSPALPLMCGQERASGALLNSNSTYLVCAIVSDIIYYILSAFQKNTLFRRNIYTLYNNLLYV